MNRSPAQLLCAISLLHTRTGAPNVSSEKEGLGYKDVGHPARKATLLSNVSLTFLYILLENFNKVDIISPYNLFAC